jgi:hypothetical protein
MLRTSKAVRNRVAPLARAPSYFRIRRSRVPYAHVHCGRVLR